MLAYFAAPLFSEAERRYNADVVSKIEKYIDVFLPQRDGGLLFQRVKAGVKPAVAEREIFQGDIGAMERADVLIALLDGSTIDDGVSFEIGFMYARGRVCIGLQTDVRRHLPTGNNPMIGCALEEIFLNDAALVDWLRRSANNLLEDRPSTRIQGDFSCAPSSKSSST